MGVPSDGKISITNIARAARICGESAPRLAVNRARTPRQSKAAAASRSTHYPGTRLRWLLPRSLHRARPTAAQAPAQCLASGAIVACDGSAREQLEDPRQHFPLGPDPVVSNPNSRRVVIPWLRNTRYGLPQVCTWRRLRAGSIRPGPDAWRRRGPTMAPHIVRSRDGACDRP